MTKNWLHITHPWWFDRKFTIIVSWIYQQTSVSPDLNQLGTRLHYRRLLFYKTRDTGTRFALKWNFLEKPFMFSEGTPPKGQWCNFSVNNQWPDLASQDLRNFFGIFTHTSFSNPRLDLAIQDLYKIILVIEQVMVLWHFLFSMSTCVKVLTLLTKLLVRKQLDVIIAHLPHLLHKIICVLIVFIEKIF